MIMAGRRKLFGATRGTAGVEMALVAPLLMILMFASIEMGNYFYDNHVVIKAVRDGARYASRRGFIDFSCPSTISNANGLVDATKNVTRTGQTIGGTARLSTWTNPNTVTVTLTCTDNSASTYSGIYEGNGDVPVVRVSAIVPYRSMFSMIGFASTPVNIEAESEIPVMGI
ncbi:MAG: TadE/TadG family type IV pilus assembly protein [Sphingomicrobium sp.]